MKSILFVGLIVINLIIFPTERIGKNKLNIKKSSGFKVDSTKIKNLYTFFNTIYKRDQFNGMVLLAENGRIFFNESFGYSNYDKKILFKSNSIFDIASSSKTFTTIAIVMLKEKGLLKYDDKVKKFIETFPYSDITIKQLLTHTSGLPDFNQFFYQIWDKSKIADNMDLYNILLKKKPAQSFKAGEKWRYSNTNYVILAMIIEKISGQTFPEFCKKKIFIPLKMNDTGILSDIETKKKNNFVEDYIFQYAENSYINVGVYPDFDNVTFTSNMYGHAGVCTSTSDLLKFDQALYSDILIKRESKEILFSPILKSDFGIGWFIEIDPQFGKSVFHPGGYGGYRAFFQRFIDKKITLIILANIDVPIWGIRKSVVNILKGKNIEYPKLSGIKELNKIIYSKNRTQIISEFNRIKKDKTRYYISEFDFSFFSGDIFNAGFYKKAEIIYRLYTLQFPESILAFEGLGDVYKKLKKKNLAIKNYKKALQLDPKNKTLKKKISEYRY